MAQADALLPRPPGGLGRAAVLALLVHAALLAMLTLGVGWRVQAPEVVSAELWSAVPQVAAPRAETPPEPTPAPPPPLEKAAPPPPPAKVEQDAEIATERAERQRREQAQAAAEAERAKQQREAEAQRQRELEAQKKKEAEQKQREADAKAKKAEQERLARLRDEQLKRMQSALGGSGAPTSTGTAARDAAPSTAYVGRLVARIKPNIVFTDDVSGNPAAEVEVSSAPTGTIIARRLVRSSGNAEWDQAVLRAIDRTGSLPPDTDGRVPSRISITFRPKE